MMSLILAAALQAQVAAVPEDGAEVAAKNTVPQTDYATAFKRSQASGRPLVVLLGADWCPACVRLKRTTLPQVAKLGGLKGVEYAYVDMDRDEKLAGALTRARSIPQLIRFEKTKKGWKRDLLVGAQSVKKVATFIRGKAEPKPEEQRSDDLAAVLTGWAESVAATE